jgi:hypothetical protein
LRRYTKAQMARLAAAADDGRGKQIVPATSSTPVLNARFLSCVEYCDAARNISQALADGTATNSTALLAGRCRLTVSKPVLKAHTRMVSALETRVS